MYQGVIEAIKNKPYQDLSIQKWFGVFVYTVPGVILPDDPRTFQMFVDYCSVVDNASHVVITSACDGIHSSRISRHYIGLALDLRIWNLDDNPHDLSQQDVKIAKEVMGRFLKVGGGKYSGVTESTHNHTQYIGVVIPSER